jgi:putative lipoic acid-binding regulatory protein
MSAEDSHSGAVYSDPWDLLDYPCRYEIKAMGRRTTRFNALVQNIVSRHIETDELLLSQTRSSRYGKYISITCIIRATSKSQIHAIYTDLAACPEVLMTL